MAKDKEREKFHQDLLMMSLYKLRRACVDAGIPVKDIRSAEEQGEEAMIELIMEKYDSGDVAPPGIRKGKPKGEVKKEKVTRTAQRAPEPDPEPEDEEPVNDPDESEEPMSMNDDDDLWGSDEDDGEPEPEPEEEPEEEPKPKRTAARKVAKKEPVVEQSGLEEQVAQLMDLQVTIAENIDSLNKTVLKTAMAIEEMQKYVVFIKEFTEKCVGNVNKFLRKNKLLNPLKEIASIRSEAYATSGLKVEKSSVSRKAKT